MKIIPRLLVPKLLAALQSSPLVFLNGLRQGGKSTLVHFLAEHGFPAAYSTFDNPLEMSAAAHAPMAYLKAKGHPLALDEVQLVPEIFRALKRIIDESRLQNEGPVTGRYLLTGSANILALPKLADALVGRMQVLTLYPFSSAEIVGGTGDFVERLFDCNYKLTTNQQLPLCEAIRLATFPEISGKDSELRGSWFDSYLTTLLQRDVHAIAELEKIHLLPLLLRTLANRSGCLINDAEVARDVALNPMTERNYRNILKMMFLSFEIAPWYKNIGKRLVKSAKGYIIDTLLLCHLLDINLEGLQFSKPKIFGHVVENFVATELLKHLSYSNTRAQLYHFRTSDGKEVDFVFEKPNGNIVGLEVKTKEHITLNDFKGLIELQKHTGEDFISGIILYPGEQTVAFEEKLWAVPLSLLWQ